MMRGLRNIWCCAERDNRIKAHIEKCNEVYARLAAAEDERDQAREWCRQWLLKNDELRETLTQSIPAIEMALNQAHTRQVDHWHKLLVRASTAVQIQEKA